MVLQGRDNQRKSGIKATDEVVGDRGDTVVTFKSEHQRPSERLRMTHIILILTNRPTESYVHGQE